MILRTLRPYAQPGLAQLRKLWVPFVAIQLVGLAIVLSYFLAPGVERAFDVLTDAKARGGVPFAAASLAIACGIVPELFKVATGVDRTLTRGRATFVAHNLVVFALIGCVQTFFYDALARELGDSRGPATVLAKTAIDMLVYSPLVTVPFICWSFTLRRRGYRVGAAIRELGVAWYLREAVPVLVVNMAYWWPMGLLMYTLPVKMTFVFGAIGSAASATLMTAIAGAAEPREPDAPATSQPSAVDRDQ